MFLSYIIVFFRLKIINVKLNFQSVKKQLFALEFSSQESCLVKCKGCSSFTTIIF